MPASVPPGGAVGVVGRTLGDVQGRPPTGPLEPVRMPTEPPLEPVPGPPDAWPRPDEPDVLVLGGPERHHVAAIIGFVGALLAVVGSLLPWARYVDGVDVTGTEQGNGWISLVLALVVAGLAGVSWVGSHVLVVRVGLAATSLSLTIVFFVNRWLIGRADARSRIGPITTANGLLLLGLAAAIVATAAIVASGPLRQVLPQRHDESRSGSDLLAS
jgi:hypothetical protein